MMSECDPTEAEGGQPAPDTGASTAASPAPEECAFQPSDPPTVLFDRNGIGLGPVTNLGGAVRISDSCESFLTELETDGSGEEALLLPCLAGSASSPRGQKSIATGKKRRTEPEVSHFL
ncbi:Phosphatidylinositol 4-kinase type 2-beta [Liparis tanakae]|uniref:Phosphatidylinositol 4-kinase type 2-beta n=1 Tax=Liparis tanakae TaxID=230148 RepID=A0A4Z2EGM5_9TELE|nr:Phosphatidylinositol 4-kinase type 2-beta [Liparis tanakae]